MQHREPGVHRFAAEFLGEFLELLRQLDLDALERVFQALRHARERQAMIYLAGNGGSAATASHWANDLAKSSLSGRLPIRVISLADNVSWLTALANDEGYEHCFSRQLETFARPGDVLVVISASGNSRNLIQAVEVARARGLTTMALLGFDGGELKHLVDLSLLLPTRVGAYGIVESAHALVCHLLAACLAGDRAEDWSEAPLWSARGE
ncbi:MAG TPA: SIS domain-containing protein [Candidatus Eisenbacteria bacterium]|nr:SIS domain-containing protein [Candidatus Eisenbacteria bacterium]